MADRSHHRIQESPEEAPGPTPTPMAVEVPAVVPEPEPVPEPTPPVPQVTPSASVMPEAPVSPATGTPPLIEAFTVLCTALQGELGDNQVAAAHCDEIQAWMANSGGDVRSANSIMAWRHCVQLLSEVLGQPMTLG